MTKYHIIVIISINGTQHLNKCLFELMLNDFSHSYFHPASVSVTINEKAVGYYYLQNTYMLLQ